ncbi:hypothetical protein [Polymorphobacter megasporae]|uniref:hypothetical protein n=1 Tax=Glacieibacterium megasporae TaxID=2835787 RepID=UPI001C1E6CCC|nr:hypothetical protein [Polymorphobacter megasporae]UAJ09870.1 hypothetical protein KTC28_16505 [Polymorphobacter megasporae]
MNDTRPARTRKADAARRQLGTALFLWLADLDPVSVHALAAGGSEIANALAKKVGKPFSAFSLEVHPTLTEGELVRVRNLLWNAMKHANHRDGRERDDEDLLTMPLEGENEARLCEGWFDLMQVIPAPMEAQVLTVWYLVKYGDPEEIDHLLNEFFPGLRSMPPVEQKDALRNKIIEVRRMDELMEDKRTDPRPLVLPA